MQLKVMTFNIHHGRGIDRKLDLNRIAEVIQESGADLIGLNEVDRYMGLRSGNMDQVQWLANRLNMNYAFGSTFSLQSRRFGCRQFGNAFLSRYPITFQFNHLYSLRFPIMETRSLLEVSVQTFSQSLKIYVTHLSMQPFFRKKQVDFIIEKMAREEQPVVLLGDLNFKPGKKAWTKLAAYLTDTAEISDFSQSYCTFPSFRPILQLDYIFVSRNIHVAAAEVIQTSPKASDHLPLVSQIILDDVGSE